MENVLDEVLPISYLNFRILKNIYFTCDNINYELCITCYTWCFILSLQLIGSLTEKLAPC